MSRVGWEILFMMLILKIPIAYLCFVVWYAIKAEPEPGTDPNDYSIWRPWRRPTGPRPRRGGPHGTRDPRPVLHAQARARGRDRSTAPTPR